MKRVIIILVMVALVVVLGLLIGFEYFLRPGLIRTAIAKSGNQPQTVSTTKATIEEWQPTLSATGSLRAINGADLSSDVAGIVGEIDFKSGDEVAAGTVLVRLRAEDDVAKLRSLQAVADLARIVYDRDRKQFTAQAVSQATIDSDDANLRNAKAQVDEQQALLDKKTIRAPFAGRLGIRAVDLGQYLAAGTTMVTLQALDPIFLDFTLPQQTLATLRVSEPVSVKVDAVHGQAFTGEITALSSKVDANTRNLQVRATLRNPDAKLLPGMFATVVISSGASQRYVTLPQAAITYSTYGDTVYLVDDKGKDPAGNPQFAARQTFVTTGATRGDQIEVTEGVHEGDVVITAGQIKIHNGSPLAINNTVQPLNDPHPSPVER